MKKILILGIILLSNVSCKAQNVMPIETIINYIKAENGIPETITYFKDINNLLDKYVGVWKGTYASKNYEFRITKYTSIYDGLSEDSLLIRYLITDANGTIIEDTRSTPDDGHYLIRGHYVDKSHYVLSYAGKETSCGQSGEVYIWTVNTNNTQMKLFLAQDQVLLNSVDCPNGRATQVLPLQQMLLIKQ